MTTKMPEAPSTALVYGAGGMGRRVVRALRARGVEVLAVLDRRAAPGSEIEGVALLAPEAGFAAFGAQHAVVIALHNPEHSVAAVRSGLHAQGWQHVYTPVDVCRWFPDALPDSYWLVSPTVYAGHANELDELSHMLVDDTSRDVLSGVLALRAEGRYEALPPPERGQYFPASLPRWPGPLRFIDCGAFDGDSLVCAKAAGYEIEQAICLEPDPENYRKLVAMVHGAGIPAICLPSAAGKEASFLHFSADNGSSSHVSSEGGTIVQALGLDQSFSGFAPNLIKMDIEGAEIDALEGAVRLIDEAQPGLAIAIYHHFSHLWAIPLLLKKLLPRHRFHLRSHAFNSFEIVLYGQRSAQV